MKILTVNASLVPLTDMVVQPFTARVVRQLLYKVAEATGNGNLIEALESGAPFKPYSLTPLYLGGRPLYKTARTPRPMILRRGLRYRFRAGFILRSMEDLEMLYGFVGRVKLYGSKSADVFIENARLLDEEEVRMPIRRGDRLVAYFETPTLLQLPKLRKDSSVNRYVPFPLPSLLFYSLKANWNAYAERKVTSGSWRANYALLIEDYDLKPVTAIYDARRRMRGFVGRAQFRITTRGAKFLEDLSRLLRFAELMNVGKSRSTGFGVVSITVNNLVMGG